MTDTERTALEAIAAGVAMLLLRCRNAETDKQADVIMHILDVMAKQAPR